MSAHTPGPWRAEDALVWATPDGTAATAVVASARCGIIGNDEYTPDIVERQNANARLIAAAPELLEALKEARQYFYDFVPAAETRSLYEKMRAAIAKAECA